MSDDPRANNVLTETLGTSLRHGESALPDVPSLLKRVSMRKRGVNSLRAEASTCSTRSSPTL